MNKPSSIVDICILWGVWKRIAVSPLYLVTKYFMIPGHSEHSLHLTQQAAIFGTKFEIWCTFGIEASRSSLMIMLDRGYPGASDIVFRHDLTSDGMPRPHHQTKFQPRYLKWLEINTQNKKHANENSESTGTNQDTNVTVCDCSMQMQQKYTLTFKTGIGVSVSIWHTTYCTSTNNNTMLSWRDLLPSLEKGWPF